MKRFKSFFGFAVMMLALATLAAGQGQMPTPYVNGTGTARGNLTIPSGNLLAFASRSFFRSSSSGIMSVEDNSALSFSAFDFGPAGAAGTNRHIQKITTGIADAVATTIFTVTIPNANHSCVVRLLFASTNGSTAAFQSTRVATGAVAVTRTTGANAVAAAEAISAGAIATVAAGATHTLAYSLGAVAGAVGATNTFTIQVTIDDSTNVGSNQLFGLADVLNNQITGCTIA